ncbi:hypothetical protein A2U01_0086565, partial [Trifolium medium]|nr:hypothetical protein [Trifolium medium]
MSPTCYDEDSERECDDKTAKRVMAFMGKYDSDSESSDEDVSDGDIAETYKLLYTKWVEACNVVEK